MCTPQTAEFSRAPEVHMHALGLEHGHGYQGTNTTVEAVHVTPAAAAVHVTPAAAAARCYTWVMPTSWQAANVNNAHCWAVAAT